VTGKDPSDPSVVGAGFARPSAPRTEPEADSAADVAAEREPTVSEMVAEQIGGVRGIVEASLPVAVFIVVNMALPSVLPDVAPLYPAIGSAVGAAVLIAAVRLARRDSIRHAVNGLFGVALAAFFAARSGKTEDFYLPGIWLSYGEGALFALSALVRRPVVGYAWAILTGKQPDWRDNPRLVRAFSILTLVFTAAFWTNSSIQLALYYASEEHALGVARLLGKSLYVGAVVLTIWYGRRVVHAEDAKAALDHDGAPPPELTRAPFESGNA
jgi:hypothetical protein